MNTPSESAHMNARERSNADGAAMRRKEARAWALLGVTVLLILVAWATWLAATGPVG